MKNILVPVDFSPHSEKAIDFAIRFAKLSKAKVIVINACELLGVRSKIQTSLEKTYNQQIIDKAYEQLELIRKSIKETEKIDINVRLYEGPIIETILKAVELHEADLVVMGTLGESGAKERIFGSKTSAVIGKATVPVLAVPFLYDWTNPKKILLAINDFDHSNGIDPLAEICRIVKASLQVAIFTDKNTEGPVTYLIEGKGLSEFEKRLQVRFPRIKISAIHLEGRRFQSTMEEYIQENDIDMLAMITHKRNLVTGLFKRSMTRKMSYHINIPLLAIPQDLSTRLKAGKKRPAARTKARTKKAKMG